MSRVRYRAPLKALACAVIGGAALLVVPETGEAQLFVRGDINQDGSIDISDAVYLLTYLALGGPAPLCDDSADVNDESTVSIADAVYVLSFLFTGTPGPPPPFPACGTDPTPDTLTCLLAFCP